MDDLDLSAVSNFDVNRDKLLRHVAIVAIFLGFNTPWSCKKRKNWHVWLSCAWLPIRNKTKPILLFHRSTMQMAGSAKKDCWDPEIVLPWLRDDVTLFSIERRRKSWRRKSWRWLPHRLSKRRSLSTTTVLFRTTFTRTIKLNLLLKWLLGSNLSQRWNC